MEYVIVTAAGGRRKHFFLPAIHPTQSTINPSESRIVCPAFNDPYRCSRAETRLPVIEKYQVRIRRRECENGAKGGAESGWRRRARNKTHNETQLAHKYVQQCQRLGVWSVLCCSGCLRAQETSNKSEERMKRITPGAGPVRVVSAAKVFAK